MERVEKIGERTPVERRYRDSGSSSRKEVRIRLEEVGGEREKEGGERSSLANGQRSIHVFSVSSAL